MTANPLEAKAHELIGQLDAGKLAAVIHVMEAMLDPLSRKLATAPPEDEEISEEEERSVAESREWLTHNDPIPHEDVLADFALSMNDFERMGRNALRPQSNGSSQ